MRWVPLVAGLTALTACTAGGGGTDGGPRPVDAFRPPDTGPMPCDDDGDCDDSFPCTLDECRVGNVCAHTALDSRCAATERCVLDRGCVAGTPSDCVDAMDCDDGDRCTGVESCLREMCVPGTPPMCNDGNACTVDTCDDSLEGMCRFELAPGCDGGTGRIDAGPMCDPFDPGTDYSGTWRVLPGQACDAGLGGGYTISNATFSVAGDTLTVTLGPFTLTQSPAPTGDAFDVSGSDGCANVRLVGSFECDERFRATFTAAHTGACAGCGTTSSEVSGRL